MKIRTDFQAMRKGAAVVSALAVLMAPVVASASGGAAAAGGFSSPATGWNELWHHVLVDLLVIGGIFAIAAVYMLWKYQAKNPGDVGTARPLTAAQALGFALIPSAIFMADDFFLAAKGWVLWNTQRTVPADAIEVKLTAQMYSWEFDYGNGLVVNSVEAPIMVPVGRPVVMRMTSNDVIHSFFIPEFRIKEDVMPGRKTYLWFKAPAAGEYLATCTEYCGAGHSQMPAKIQAVEPAAFDAWVASKGKQAAAPVATNG